MTLILGSQSPRRKEILGYFDIPFIQASPIYDEEALPFNNNPEEYVNTLAKGKADSLRQSYPNNLILTADTIVYRQGKIYGKPQDADDGFRNLKELVGRWHHVFTGVTLMTPSGQAFQKVAETRVLFNPLSDSQIHTYQEKLHCWDKAGGYMIQSAGSLIVKRIEGCYYNVMGLPINVLCELFQRVGIDLWNHFKSTSYVK